MNAQANVFNSTIRHIHNVIVLGVNDAGMPLVVVHGNAELGNVVQAAPAVANAKPEPLQYDPAAVLPTPPKTVETLDSLKAKAKTLGIRGAHLYRKAETLSAKIAEVESAKAATPAPTQTSTPPSTNDKPKSYGGRGKPSTNGQKNGQQKKGPNKVWMPLSECCGKGKFYSRRKDKWYDVAVWDIATRNTGDEYYIAWITKDKRPILDKEGKQIGEDYFAYHEDGKFSIAANDDRFKDDASFRSAGNVTK